MHAPVLDQDHVSMEAFRPRLRRTALRLIKNETDAEDIVQEAFTRWYTSAPADTRFPEAWLVTVVHNLCIDAQRFRMKEKPCDIRGFSHLAAKKVVDVDRFVDQEDDIAVILRHLSERATTEEALALLLREAFGYSYEELSRILNKKQDACRQLVHRGKCAAQGTRTKRRRRMPSQHATVAFIEAVRHCNMEAAVAVLYSVTR